MILTARILYLIFANQVSQNNVLILQFVTPWVSELAQLSIYADIFRRLGSGTNFRQSSIFSNLQQYSFSNPADRKKYTDFDLTLQPTTTRYTWTFSTIWVSIDFYFFVFSGEYSENKIWHF